MAFYGKRLIKDYIMGNNIYGYNISDLEDDYHFMMNVINYTNDKKMYNLCGDNVKKNPIFIKFLITKFKDDFDFALMVANEYIKSIDDNNDIGAIEISILMCKYFKNNESDDLIPFKIRLSSFCVEKRMLYEQFRKKKDNVQMGFRLVLLEYKNSKIIRDFLADRFVYEIFAGLNLSANSYYNISNEMILNTINKFDSFLFEYVKNNLCFDDYIFKYVKKILYNNANKKNYNR